MGVKVLQIESVVADPKIRAGKPVVAGTGVRVSDLAAYHIAGGLSAGQLAVQFGLQLDQVHAALAYYYSHKAEIDAEIRENEREAEHWKNLLTRGGRCLTLA